MGSLLIKWPMKGVMRLLGDCLLLDTMDKKVIVNKMVIENKMVKRHKKAMKGKTGKDWQ